MDAGKFSRMAESLRKYRRAELKDFEADIAVDPLDAVYVDPLQGDAILNTILSSNTTFISGRKGTGKSTIFAKAQSEMRKRKDLLSIYVDVKALYDTVNASEVPFTDIGDVEVSQELYRSHMIRKSFLAAVLSELITEIKVASEKMSLWDRWTGKQWDYNQLVEKLSLMSGDVKSARLTNEEIPILKRITEKTRTQRSTERTSQELIGAGGKASASDPGLVLSAQIADMDTILSDNEIYTAYSDVILRSFPFVSLLVDIKNLLDEAGIKRLVVFFDDFSELDWIDQKLFVDVILAPLNNTSDERVKLKVACYPGRVYYGKIDPGKVDIVHLDFSKLYEASDMMRSSTQTKSKGVIKNSGGATGQIPLFPNLDVRTTEPKVMADIAAANAFSITQRLQTRKTSVEQALTRLRMFSLDLQHKVRSVHKPEISTNSWS